MTFGQNKDVSIVFVPKFAKQEFNLGTNYITSNKDTVGINLYRIYLADFILHFKDGTVYKENNSYHLLDLEKPLTLGWDFLNVPRGEVTGVTFTIGLDSVISCSGAMTGDLDPMYGMYWAWNSGYINAKMEGYSSSCATRNNEFLFHIGGYKTKEATIQKVELGSPENNDRIEIIMDLSTWFRDVDLKKDNSVLVPGKNAVLMAKRYKNMFSLN